MNVGQPLERCLLCDSTGPLRPAGFRQAYKQVGRAPIFLSWWECRACTGWFASPVPTPSEIESHCNRANYNDPSQARAISEGKGLLQKRILTRLTDLTEIGPLLDVGCSFGEFLVMAGRQGWTPSGLEPYGPAATVAENKGFDVRCEWVLSQAGFPDKHFAAVVAVDSFCFVWEPFQTLRTMYQLLQPGGILAMRITNKHAILKLTRLFSSPGSRRDAWTTAVLKGQFHSISADRLGRILGEIGFDWIELSPSATTSHWSQLSRGTRMAYSVAQMLYRGTFGYVNLSPGVLLFARKAR